MSEQDTLPEEFEGVGIKDLLEGEIVYTVPWSVWVKLDSTAAINGNYDFKADPHGTLSMKISRAGDRILVYTDTLKDHKFTKSDSPSHAGAKEEDYIPVRFVK